MQHPYSWPIHRLEKLAKQSIFFPWKSYLLVCWDCIKPWHEVLQSHWLFLLLKTSEWTSCHRASYPRAPAKGQPTIAAAAMPNIATGTWSSIHAAMATMVRYMAKVLGKMQLMRQTSQHWRVGSRVSVCLCWHRSGSRRPWNMANQNEQSHTVKCNHTVQYSHTDLSTITQSQVQSHRLKFHKTIHKLVAPCSYQQGQSCC